MDALNTDNIIENLIKEKCSNLENIVGGKIFFIRAPMAMGVDDFIRREIENIAPNNIENSKLSIILETTGGSIEVVERLNDVFRHHFETIDFIIPNFAYSAGTVLSLSGDNIFMDYYSVLGPIDPQIKNNDGKWVPGLGLLEKYDEIINKENISLPEVEFLIRKFDPAELFSLEQAKNHSVELISKWLVKYKFKNWSERCSSKAPVTNDYKEQRARDIAARLGDPKVWNSHGRGISLKTLESEDIKLKIINFGDNSSLNSAIRGYYDLLMDYCRKKGSEIILHSSERLVLLGT